MSTTVVIKHTSPLTGVVSGAKRGGMLKLANFITGLASGAKKGTSIDIYTDSTTAAAASATLTFVSCAAGHVIEVNGVPFTAVAGTAVTANNEFSIDTDDTATATSFAAAITASTSTGIQYVVAATSALGVVTLTAVQLGDDANAITLKSLGVVAQATITCASVANADTVTLNGVVFTAKTAPSGTDEWARGGTDTVDGAALTAAINASATALVSGHLRALNRAGAVTVYSKFSGDQGNLATIATSSGVTLAITGALSRLGSGVATQGEGARATGTIAISGGSGNYTCTVNGQATGNVAFNVSDTQTAADLADAVNKLSSVLVGHYVHCTAAAGTLTCTAIRGGVYGNSITFAGTGTGTTVSGARLTGGAAPTTAVASGERFSSGAGGATTEIQYTL